MVLVCFSDPPNPAVPTANLQLIPSMQFSGKAMATANKTWRKQAIELHVLPAFKVLLQGRIFFHVDVTIHTWDLTTPIQTKAECSLALRPLSSMRPFPSNILFKGPLWNHIEKTWEARTCLVANLVSYSLVCLNMFEWTQLLGHQPWHRSTSAGLKQEKQSVFALKKWPSLPQ